MPRTAKPLPALGNCDCGANAWSRAGCNRRHTDGRTLIPVVCGACGEETKFTPEGEQVRMKKYLMLPCPKCVTGRWISLSGTKPGRQRRRCNACGYYALIDSTTLEVINDRPGRGNRPLKSKPAVETKPHPSEVLKHQQLNLRRSKQSKAPWLAQEPVPKRFVPAMTDEPPAPPPAATGKPARVKIEELREARALAGKDDLW